MTAITADPANIDALITAKGKAHDELREMLRINFAFSRGENEFSRLGYSPDDYQRFADTITNNPEYGLVPFPPRLITAKMAQIRRYEKLIVIGNQFLA